MTLFEYISVAISLVLSLAAVRVLSGLSVAFAEGRRFWVHAAWLVMVLGISALVWWNFWSFRDADWNLFRFLMVLAAPGSIYLMGAALVPESPSEVASWEEHFFFARRRFFLALGAFFVTVSTTSCVLLEIPWMTAARASQIVGFTLAVVGVVSPSRRVHRILPIAFAVLLAAVSFLIFERPGSLNDV